MRALFGAAAAVGHAEARPLALGVSYRSITAFFARDHVLFAASDDAVRHVLGFPVHVPVDCVLLGVLGLGGRALEAVEKRIRRLAFGDLGL